VLLVDCRRDHIDRRLNLYYSLDVIFRLSFLVTAGEGFGQGRALVEQLVSRFLKDVHLVLGHDQLSISSGAKFCSALQLLAASSVEESSTMPIGDASLAPRQDDVWPKLNFGHT